MRLSPDLSQEVGSGAEVKVMLINVNVKLVSILYMEAYFIGIEVRFRIPLNAVMSLELLQEYHV